MEYRISQEQFASANAAFDANHNYYPDPGDAQVIESAGRLLDTNGDGAITRTEVQSVVDRAERDGATRPETRALLMMERALQPSHGDAASELKQTRQDLQRRAVARRLREVNRFPTESAMRSLGMGAAVDRQFALLMADGAAELASKIESGMASRAEQLAAFMILSVTESEGAERGSTLCQVRGAFDECGIYPPPELDR